MPSRRNRAPSPLRAGAVRAQGTVSRARLDSSGAARRKMGPTPPLQHPRAHRRAGLRLGRGLRVIGFALIKSSPPGIAPFPLFILFKGEKIAFNVGKLRQRPASPLSCRDCGRKGGRETQTDKAEPAAPAAQSHQNSPYRRALPSGAPRSRCPREGQSGPREGRARCPRRAGLGHGTGGEPSGAGQRRERLSRASRCPSAGRLLTPSPCSGPRCPLGLCGGSTVPGPLSPRPRRGPPRPGLTCPISCGICSPLPSSHPPAHSGPFFFFPSLFVFFFFG